MPVTTGAVHITGLRELQRAFARCDVTARTELRIALREVAEPVRRTAESLAVQNIRNIGPAWSQMRVGITTNRVYVAERQRGGRGRTRPNLAPLLMERAMEPALEQNTGLIVEGLEHVLDTVGAAFER